MKSIKSLDYAVWTAITVLIALTLIINAVSSLFGKTDFAWWHLVTLLLCHGMRAACRKEDSRSEGR
ncbi:MAG: hypothetical protein PUK70_01775 [Bacteroidales bacterium]|nr:hypothetical protein [Bacteroidales bacterium]MDY6002636.1 hypothetical protein [Candidatus Cryptobacteroides sp.]